MRLLPALTLASLLIAPLLAVTGCYRSPVAQVRAQAEVACLDRFSKLTNLSTDNVTTNDMDPDDNVADSDSFFRINSTGQFAAEFPPITNLDQPYTLRCTGDVNKRELTSIQINGELHRPAANEKWTF